MNDRADVRTDFEGIDFKCPKCGCELCCGIEWDDEDNGEWTCEECHAPYSISVLHMGYAVDVHFEGVTLEGFY